ncbi:MAG: glycoside hydrolase family protein [Akkermansiaceae bacterium]
MKILRLAPLAISLGTAIANDTTTSWEHAPSEYVTPAGMPAGAAFIDRILPMPIDSPLRADIWGGDNVKPRNAANGLEDPDWSYWCMSVHHHEGKEHMFATRWSNADPRGHSAWPQSTIVHATSDKPTGPFKIEQEIGPGHNVMCYRTQDGTYVLYVIGRAYKSKSIEGPWEPFELKYDTRGFPELPMSNHTFTMREDGSYLMSSRGGQIWISRDGLQPYRKITAQTPYPPVRGRFEDPVVWRDEVQYHMLVNDWFGRTAFYLRSPDGVDWTVDPGIAYDTTVARSADGTRERWYKFERPNVRQDAFGRATHLYLAVIDTGKKEDVGNDIHGSKIIAMPLVVDRRMEILNRHPLAADGKIELLIRAEEGFEPARDLDPAALTFGSPSAVDFGKGARVLEATPAGGDLKLTFAVNEAGFHPDDYVGKLLGRDRKGEIVTGFARLPGKSDPHAILSPTHPRLVGRGALAVTVENFGLAASDSTTMQVCFKAAVGDVLERIIQVPVPALKPYEAAEVTVPIGSDWLKRGTEARVDLLLPSGSGHSRLTACTVALP